MFIDNNINELIEYMTCFYIPKIECVRLFL